MPASETTAYPSSLPSDAPTSLGGPGARTRIAERVQAGSVRVNDVVSNDDPLWFPYTEEGHTWFKKGLRAMFGGGLMKWISALFRCASRAGVATGGRAP